MDISFHPLLKEHLPLIHDWFNQPHVQTFYSLRKWTFQEVQDKFKPYLCPQSPIAAFMIYCQEHPMGYIQKYAIHTYPWPDQDLDSSIVEKAAGIDLFIGDPSFLNQGIGKKIIPHFLTEHIWPYNEFCLVDPHCNNTRSIHFFELCGFEKHKIIATTDALHHPVKLQLMIKKRPSSLLL